MDYLRWEELNDQQVGAAQEYTSNPAQTVQPASYPGRYSTQGKAYWQDNAPVYEKAEYNGETIKHHVKEAALMLSNYVLSHSKTILHSFLLVSGLSVCDVQLQQADA